jgi:ribonuclease E
VSSVALHLLRMLEEMLLKGATHNLIVRTRSEVALYVLNHKRAHLRELESRFQITLTVNADATIGAAQPFLIEKGEQVHSIEAAKAIAAQAPAATVVEEHEDDFVEEAVEEEAPEEAEGEAEAPDEASDGAPAEAEARDDSQHRGRRRRRGRGGREGREGGREPREGGREPREGGFSHETVAERAIAHEGNGDAAAETGEDRPDRGPAGVTQQNGDGEHHRRRRGRRGGRRNRRGREGEPLHGDAPFESAEPEVVSAVADFGGAPPVGREPMPEHQAPPYQEPSFTPEPARRRSTIREPAPILSSDAPAQEREPAAPPVPEPAAASPEPAPSSEAEAKPRRFGWWNKRG